MCDPVKTRLEKVRLPVKRIRGGQVASAPTMVSTEGRARSVSWARDALRARGEADNKSFGLGNSKEYRDRKDVAVAAFDTYYPASNQVQMWEFLLRIANATDDELRTLSLGTILRIDAWLYLIANDLSYSTTVNNTGAKASRIPLRWLPFDYARSILLLSTAIPAAYGQNERNKRGGGASVLNNYFNHVWAYLLNTDKKQTPNVFDKFTKFVDRPGGSELDRKMRQINRDLGLREIVMSINLENAVRAAQEFAGPEIDCASAGTFTWPVHESPGTFSSKRIEKFIRSPAVPDVGCTSVISCGHKRLRTVVQEPAVSALILTGPFGIEIDISRADFASDPIHKCVIFSNIGEARD